MIARVLIVAAAALIGANNAGAEPAQSSRDAQHAQAPSPRLLLASADEVRNPAPAEQQAPQPSKQRRIARVTTCRCGGDAPLQDEQEQ